MKFSKTDTLVYFSKLLIDLSFPYFQFLCFIFVIDFTICIIIFSIIIIHINAVEQHIFSGSI